ncbi:MAG: peptide deformylase [Anaerolineales bacterium]|nr:peptide deformylase [Anaerolineales bacterium]
MIRKIVVYPDPGLMQVSSTITEFGEELRALVKDMYETLYAAPGIGLAAPQVGVNQRVVVLDLTAGEEEGNQVVLVNPQILEEEGIQKEEEGCLSLPDLQAVVGRPARAKVSAQDLEGNFFEIEGEGLLARALSHEIDHLKGVLYIDKLSFLKKDLMKRKIKKLIKAGEWY